MLCETHDMIHQLILFSNFFKQMKRIPLQKKKLQGLPGLARDDEHKYKDWTWTRQRERRIRNEMGFHYSL